VKRSLSLFAVLVGASYATAIAASQAPAIAEFDHTFADVTDFTCALHVHEVKGSKVQDRVYQYSFMKPHYVKTLVVGGSGKGSGAVWIGGDQVSAHLGGVLSFIHVKIGVDDPRAVSLRGVTIPQGLLPGVVDDYGTIPGTLTETDGGKIGGVATDRLELDVADPSSNHGVSEQVLYISKVTHWPVRQIMYSGSQVVLDEWVSNLKTDVGLKLSDFPF
jgi:hypothetical protein